MRRRNALPKKVKPVKRSHHRRLIVALAALVAVGGAGYWAFTALYEPAPVPFAFGDGGVSVAQAQERLAQTSAALMSDEGLVDARLSGDPYYLVTRLAEWDSEGWYRIGIGDTRAWGVAVDDEGAVVIAREVEEAGCFARRIHFNAVSISETGETLLTPRAVPIVEEGFSDLYPCDPADPRRYTWVAAGIE